MHAGFDDHPGDALRPITTKASQDWRRFPTSE